MSTPRVAPPDALESHPTTSQRPVLLDSLYHKLRTSRGVTAGIGEIRRQRRLVNPYQKNEYWFHLLTTTVWDICLRRVVFVGLLVR